jgi:predicted lipoprotein with Yx(FWY)xxD motif
MISERSTGTSAPQWGRRDSSTRRRTLAVISLAAFAAASVIGATGVGVASAGTPTVQVATNAKFGTILTNDSGLALYTLDTDHNGQSTCHGACAAAWPPVNVPAGTVPTGGPGVTGTVASSKQSNGILQVTYNGAPLYTFVSDTSPGQVTGNGVAGFSVVVVSMVASTTTTTAPPKAPTSSATPSGTASPGASSTSPAPTAAAMAPSAGSTAAASSTAPGKLAFTGAGPGLWWLLLVGLLLVLSGAVMALGRARRPSRRSST